MTTIAFDGTTLAADRAAWSSGQKYRVRKVARTRAPDGRRFLVAACGDGGFASLLIAWMEGGPHPGVYPGSERDTFTIAVVIDERRRIWRLDSNLRYQRVHEKVHACGAGQDYAIGALEAGATARQAVQIAMKRSDYAGLGVKKHATADEIKAAFRRRASELHPDKNHGGDTSEQMAAINRAYGVLGDPEKRKVYDELGGDSSGPTIEDQALQLVASMFSRAIETGVSDILGFVRGQMNAARDEFGNRAAAMESEITRLTARRDKVRVKFGENLLHGIIDNRVAAARQSIKQAKIGAAVAAAGLMLLEAYEADPEPQPTSGAWGMGSSANSSLREQAKQFDTGRTRWNV